MDNATNYYSGKPNGILFAKLYGKHAKAMLNMGMRYAADASLATAAMNRGFLAIYREMTSQAFDRPQDLDNWIAREMAGRISQRVWNAKKRKKTSAIDEIMRRAKAEARDHEPAPFRYLDMLAGLGCKDRVVFNLFYMERFQHREIAEMLGITDSMSAQTSYEAWKILRDKIEPYRERGECTESFFRHRLLGVDFAKHAGVSLDKNWRALWPRAKAGHCWRIALAAAQRVVFVPRNMGLESRNNEQTKPCQQASRNS